MYDVFFLSYDETYADNAFEWLDTQHGSVRRVHGIAGIQNGHRRCAELSRTDHFFVVDADNTIIDMSVFDYRVPSYDSQYVHLWYAENPLNGLAYGWGGLKLFPKKLFTNIDHMPLDMTTAFELKIIPKIASVTNFNVSPFETWRSAFRETVKLQVGAPTREQRERLYGWCNVAVGRNAAWALCGANEGVEFANEHLGTPSLLSINDYAWLKTRFYAAHGEPEDSH